MRSLEVYIDKRRMGELNEGEDIWQFTYDAEWAKAPDSFDLAPGLPRAQLVHVDGGTNRPVQWYFDNLLPEEMLRQAISKEAGIKGEDAFALLEYLGQESAGSLTLLPPGQSVPAAAGLRELADEQLSERISTLPKHTLAAESPKRMSIAGAQHKLLVVLRDNQLFEPEGATPSTHILKPNHPQSNNFPASVINEYVVMRLARGARLNVPDVHIRYVPDPVYIIDRFDRIIHNSPNRDPTAIRHEVGRLHIIDACQLLNRSRVFKYSGASLDALKEVINATTNKVHTRMALYRWLVFNVLVANDDSHLKNLSFYVSSEGVRLAPHYDLLATGAYYTRAIANEGAKWPHVEMAIALPGAKTFGEVTKSSMIQAGGELGLPARVAERVLQEVTQLVTKTLEVELAAVAKRHQTLDEKARVNIAAEAQLMRILASIIIREMAQKLAA